MIDNKRKIHVRRCHVCSAVNEHIGSPVIKCDGCGKFLAPFMFFDERNDLDPRKNVPAENMNIDEVRLKAGTLYEDLKSQYPPLWGITVYW